MNLYFLGFTDLLLSFCFDGISKKRKNALLSGALLSFCMVCEIFFVQVFRLLEKTFCHCSLSRQFFATKPFVYTPCYTHNQIFSFGRCWGTFGALTPTTFSGKSFQLRIQQCALCCCHCCGRVAMSVSGFPCTNGRSFLFQSFRHKKVVLFTLSGQYLGWFTLRLSFEAVERSSLPSFYLYLLFPTACLTFNFSSLLIIPQNPIEGAQGKFKLQKMPNCVWVAQLFRGLSCLYKPISLPLIINRGYFFQTCPTASTTWLHVAMIMKVLSWVVLSFWWLPKGEIILLKICLSFYATHGTLDGSLHTIHASQAESFKTRLVRESVSEYELCLWKTKVSLR